MNIETKGIVILSLTLVLIACIYAWVNRHHYHIYTPGGFTIVIRENIFTMDRCTLRLGYLTSINNPDDYYYKLNYFPELCEDTPNKSDLEDD